MKKIIFLLVIFLLVVFFTKFYDANDTIEFWKIFKNLRYNIENFIWNNKWKNNWEIINWENINKNNEEKPNWSNIINNDLIKYENWNIIYIDENWKIFTWIWTITLNYNDNNITILDRNLWATTNDINSENSFWYYFQRWNNYGFSLNTWKINTEEKQVNINWYWPSEYSNSTFNIWEYGERISINTNSNTKLNLWWGWLDSEENNRWINNTNYTQKNRQWPCPNWYHVPSLWEWNILFESWIEIYTWQWYKLECLFNGVKWLKMISFNNHCNERIFVNSFITTFKIPLAGSLVYRNLYHNDLTNFWTSTYRWSFEVWERYINSNRHPTYADAMPIRCFSNNNTYNY